MATKLLQVITWTRPFIGNMLLLNDGTLDPAVSNANLILGLMFAPPFVWEWNRDVEIFSLTATLTDYTRSIPDFGFMESGSITVPSGATADANSIYQLQPRRSLEISNPPGRPGFVSVFLDDQAGNITFRVGLCSPDQAYPVAITYQKAIQPITSIEENIPVPDKMMHIFRFGFMALALFYTQDDRFSQMNQKFIASLLGSQHGLDEGQSSVFLRNWYSLLSGEGMVGLRNQQGVAARGSE